MANISKAERQRREAEKEAQLREEIEAKIRAEYEEKELAAKNADKAKKEKENAEKLKTAKRIQNAKRIPLDTIIPVVCTNAGGLIYVSKKTMGYTVEWEDIGSVEYMELGELASMKNTDRRFFSDNWIVIEDSEDYTAMEIYDFLKISNYYPTAFTPEKIDEVFTYSKDKIAKVCSGLSKGLKETIAVRAKQKLDEDTLDKNIIDTLEDVLGIQFTF